MLTVAVSLGGEAATTPVVERPTGGAVATAGLDDPRFLPAEISREQPLLETEVEVLASSTSPVVRAGLGHDDLLGRQGGTRTLGLRIVSAKTLLDPPTLP